MDEETQGQVLEKFRDRYGDGGYAYAKRTIASWRSQDVQQVGLTVTRLLEVVPLFVDLETKFELAGLIRQETLKRVRQSQFSIEISSKEDLWHAAAQMKEIIDAQLTTKLPEGVIQSEAWLTKEYGSYFEQMLLEAEKRLLYGRAKDFIRRANYLLAYRSQIPAHVQIHAIFELPTSLFTLRIVQPRKDGMNQETYSDDSGLLAKWNDLELETRFKSGEVSYPEYVLRNMDQFFTKEEQSELHKIAAMHGLELERLLMEIQIKSRTSEADLQKLLTTLRTLQEKKISADVVSRHETPSGHIEISARNRRAIGCLPVGILFALAMFAVEIAPFIR
jgi:hypothetical protein